MMKKIIALSLCLLMVVAVFTGCSGSADDKGAYVQMYITDPIYNFDPARAYGNESALKIISLMFDNLFVLNSNGKVEKSLAKDYKVYEDAENKEYKMIITLKTTAWSDGINLTANDVVYSWKRILDSSNSFEAAPLLYDIMYAREAKTGEMSIDDVRIYALNENQVEIFFTGKIDYDRFLRNLTSYALVPIRENMVNLVANEIDWAKKPTIFAASGPFKLRNISYEPGAEGLILERNDRYFRDIEKDAIDKSVVPYRLIVDYSMTDEELMNAYKKGDIFYVGNIPLSVRSSWVKSKELKKSDALSTHTYMLNQNAVIRYYDANEFRNLSKVNTEDKQLVEGTDGEKIFADAKVRQALSLVIDRNAIVNAVYFGKVATGLVPDGVYETNSAKTTFRSVGDTYIKAKANEDAAEKLLEEAGVDAKKFMFAISVPAYDDVHMEIAKHVQEAWSKLGFKVAIQAIDVVDNQDIDKTTKDIITGIKDDVFAERYMRGEFEVAAIDYVALSVDPFSVLAPFAKTFTGGAASSADSPVFEVPNHVTGYYSEAFNKKIEAANKTQDAKKRAELLHEAEKILMDDMPAIPIIFNENATLTSKSLSNYKISGYNTPIFTKLKLKNYQDYIPAEEKAK